MIQQALVDFVNELCSSQYIPSISPWLSGKGMLGDLTLTSCDAINSQILKGIDNAQEWHS
jgi:hypothetical protein